MLLFGEINFKAANNVNIANLVMATVNIPVAYVGNTLDFISLKDINEIKKIYNNVGNNHMDKNINDAKYEFSDSVIIVDRKFLCQDTIDKLIATYISENPKLHIGKTQEKYYNIIHNTIAVDSQKEVK